MKLRWTMRKIKIVALALFPAAVLFAAAPSEKDGAKRSVKELVKDGDFKVEPSIWESEPIETDNATVQILDKVSGKVYRENIKLNSEKIFGSIKLKLKRCFKNSPEDDRETAAFIEITENGKIIFANWLFASSPSANLFAHPLYDVRVEF